MSSTRRRYPGAGGSLRISARLVNVADGFQIWGGNFQRELGDPSDVFRVQDEIATAIVHALELELGDGSGTRRRHQPASLAAYQAFLDGRFFMAKRTVDGLRRAADSFREALALDSTFALAWAGLADAEALSLTYGFISPSETYARARSAAEHPLMLDSTLAEAYASLGFLGVTYSWDWEEADRHFRRAIALDPNYTTAHHWQSIFFNAVGREEEALRAIRRARELDPVSLIVNRELGRTHYYMGAIDSALTHCSARL